MGIVMVIGKHAMLDLAGIMLLYFRLIEENLMVNDYTSLGVLLVDMQN